MAYDGAIFGGPARRESRNYWLGRERAEAVLVPDISRFGEKHEVTGEQTWEEVPAGSALEGFLLPQPPGKDYRLLKVVTQPATEDQLARLGNDRAPVVVGMRDAGYEMRDAGCGNRAERIECASPPCAMPKLDDPALPPLRQGELF